MIPLKSRESWLKWMIRNYILECINFATWLPLACVIHYILGRKLCDDDSVDKGADYRVENVNPGNSSDDKQSVEGARPLFDERVLDFSVILSEPRRQEQNKHIHNVLPKHGCASLTFTLKKWCGLSDRPHRERLNSTQLNWTELTESTESWKYAQSERQRVPAPSPRPPSAFPEHQITHFIPFPTRRFSWVDTFFAFNYSPLFSSIYSVSAKREIRCREQ